MAIAGHPGFHEEKQHLDKTLQWVEKEKVRLENLEDKLIEEIRLIRKSVTHLADERLIAKQLLHQFTTKDIKVLNYAQDTPYFGRIDFKENARDEVEKIYIGKHGLHDSESEMPIVVDWRAPIADIYYSGHGEDVFYKAPYGEIHGRMFLKRRYEISQGELIEIFDEKSSEKRIEESLQGKGDFLIEALNKSNQGRLKEIVATIQDQQNKVIRRDMLRPLVVQGVAGGGKTTIALHRMAYLIYNNRRNIQNANYMVIAPNKLFLNYISEILPDLGVEDVVQTTFEEWALKLIKKRIKLGHQIDQLNLLMGAETESVKTTAAAAKVKGSFLFKKVVDNSLRIFEKKLIPRHPLYIEGIPVVEFEKIYEVFMTSNLHLSLKDRINKLKEYLKNKVKNDIQIAYQIIEATYEKKLNALKRKALDLESVRPQIIQLYDERDEKIKQFKKQISPGVDEYISSFQKLEVFSFYRNIFLEDEIIKAFKNRLGEVLFSSAIQKITEQLSADSFENEDLAPLAYLHLKFFGIDEKSKFNHIVVDEAQDFDEFKICVIKEIVINDSFTFVGDLSQGIYSYRGITNWNKTMERVFANRDYYYHVLTTSYRSTVEIVNFANGIIQKCEDLEPVLAQPVFRNGQKPLLVQCEKEVAMVDAIIQQFNALRHNEYQSIAVICKDLATTKEVYEKLSKKINDAYLLTEQTTDFKNGIVVIPSYLSKGLEFDAVLIWNVNDRDFPINSMNVKLLYIAATRALHYLVLFYAGRPSQILYELNHLIELEEL